MLRPVVGESLAHLGESSRAGLEGKVRSRERREEKSRRGLCQEARLLRSLAFSHEGRGRRSARFNREIMWSDCPPGGTLLTIAQGNHVGTSLGCLSGFHPIFSIPD